MFHFRFVLNKSILGVGVLSLRQPFNILVENKVESLGYISLNIMSMILLYCLLVEGPLVTRNNQYVVLV